MSSKDTQRHSQPQPHTTVNAQQPQDEPAPQRTRCTLRTGGPVSCHMEGEARSYPHGTRAGVRERQG